MAATDNSKFLSKTQYEVTLQRLAQVTGRTLGADSNNAFKANLSSSDRVLGSWTHPTATARTLTTANQVIKSLTVDAYGHVTAATQGALAAADIPSLAASKITSGTFGVARGGTGLSTIAAFSILYASAKDTLTTLAPNTTSTKKFLRMTGNGSAGAAPAWDTLAATDIPNLDWSKITSGKPTTISGYGITDAKIEAVTGGDKITLGSTNITIADWAQGTGTKIAATALPTLYVGRTAVSSTASNKTLLGVNGFTNTATAGTETDKSLVVWDSTNNAWHFQGNIYADGWVSAAGVSESGGGGGGTSGLYVVDAWNDIDISDGDQVLGSVLGANINNRLTTLEGKATAVSFTQTLTSGKQIGTITIDGTSKNLYAPSTYALSDITGADDLKAIEALTGTSGFLKKTAENTWSLDTNSYVTTANGVTGVSFTTSGTNAGKIGVTKNGSTTYTSSVWASAALTGTPTAPTASAGTNTTQIATTAFVSTAISNAISGVTSFEYVIAWNGTSTPTVANIPAGVKVVYNGTTYTGTKASGEKGTVYLVYSANGDIDTYDEYMYFSTWERLGSFGETNLADYWLKTDLVAITATENTTLLNSYFPVS